MQNVFRKRGALRDFMVFEVKAPLTGWLNIENTRQLVTFLNNIRKLPEPTKENTKKQNSHVLIEIRDEFLSRLRIKSRIKPLRTIINFIINVYEYDEPYEQLIDWWASELFARRDEWLPIGRSKPDILIWKQGWQLEEESDGK